MANTILSHSTAFVNKFCFAERSSLLLLLRIPPFTPQLLEKMNEVCCPLCIVKPQTNFGSELSFNFNHFISTKDHYIHQQLHPQIIPNIAALKSDGVIITVANHLIVSERFISKDILMTMRCSLKHTKERIGRLGVVLWITVDLDISFPLCGIPTNLLEVQSFPFKLLFKFIC